MTPTTYGRDFAYCLKSHGGVRGFNASLWRFLLRCTLFCHSVATFLTSVSSYEGGCGFEATLKLFIKFYILTMSMKKLKYYCKQVSEIPYLHLSHIVFCLCLHLVALSLSSF